MKCHIDWLERGDVIIYEGEEYKLLILEQWGQGEENDVWKAIDKMDDIVEISLSPDTLAEIVEIEQ